MNKFNTVKTLLDNDVEVCKHLTNIDDIRKIIARLKTDEFNYLIYRNICNCNLSKRQHFSYEKDWAYEG